MAYDDFKIVLCNLSEILGAEGIDWAITGAVAANQYRDEVRATTDIDLLLALAGTSIDTLGDALQKRGWSSTDVVADWLLRAEHPRAGRLDILASTTDYEVGAISRSNQVTFDFDNEHTFNVLAIEDVLILKLVADRYSDNADVESILATYPKLDWDYMGKWIETFELEERLRRIEDGALKAGILNRRIIPRLDRRNT